MKKISLQVWLVRFRRSVRIAVDITAGAATVRVQYTRSAIVQWLQGEGEVEGVAVARAFRLRPRRHQGRLSGARSGSSFLYRFIELTYSSKFTLAYLYRFSYSNFRTVFMALVVQSV